MAGGGTHGALGYPDLDDARDALLGEERLRELGSTLNEILEHEGNRGQ